MSYKPVEAVFVIFYGLTTHKAVYGRAVADRTYSKDYIQLVQSASFRQALEDLFPRDPGAKATAITYKWPGGSSPGSVEFESADRPHLAWLMSVGAPDPWRMTPSPSDAGPRTLPGDPLATNVDAANAQFKAIIDEGMQPYLIAVKLKDEENTLHVRAYVKNPTSALAFADIDKLPAPVAELAGTSTKNSTFKWERFDSHTGTMSAEIAAVVERLDENPSLLLIGPPGTGKTVLLESLVDFIENPKRGVLFDPEKNHDAWEEAPDVAPGMARTVVLHPSLAYDNMVIGLLPEPTPSGVGVRVTTGPLVNLAHYASVSNRKALLVLDEFNRGNAAAILGDALALLDKDKRGSTFIDLPYGHLPINVPTEFSINGSVQVSPRFTLPENLWIVAAMNTSDRSVAPLDAALRRRFTIVEMAPDYDLLATRLGADLDSDLSAGPEIWSFGHVGKLAVLLLQQINERIDSVSGPDFRLGHSNFWNVRGDTPSAAILSLIAAFDHRIVQSLRLSLQDDDGALAAIMRAGTPEQSGAKSDSAAAYWKQPDPDLGTYASPRLHINQLSALPLTKALPELRRQAKA